MKQYLSSWNGRILGTLFLGVAIGGAVLLSACGESEPADVLAAPSTQSSEDGAAFGFGTSLSLEGLPDELTLTEDQRAGLAVAIDELNSAREEMRSRFQAERPRVARDGRGGRDGNSGPAGPGRMGGPGHGLADDFEPPMMTFLSTAAGLLDRDQFVILAQYLSDNRPDRPGHMDRPGRHGGVRQGTEGNGFGDRMAGRLAEELGLSDEQASALRQVVSSYRDRFRDLREAVRDGQTSPSDALADAITLASAMKAELAAVLTAEQLELFAEHKSERVIQGIERRLGNLDERMTQRSAMIAAALDMDDAQAQQTESIFIGTVAARSAVLNGLRDGSIAPEVAAFRVIAIEKDAWAEVYALLTPEQQAAWDSLRDLLPGSRGGF